VSRDGGAAAGGAEEAEVRTLEARWATPTGRLRIAEPDAGALALAAGALAGFYNEPRNAALLSNTLVFSPDDVLQYWADAADDGSRAFLLSCDGELVGDADFRNVGGGAAELAILIGPPGLQGRGLGGRFLLMLLALGVEVLRLDRIYVAIRPENEASLRLFARAGFTRDDTPAGRAYADEDDDVCLVLFRDELRSRHAAQLSEIEIV
jgi:RimJ/RimL family protein N-acetyltransferase